MKRTHAFVILISLFILSGFLSTGYTKGKNSEKGPGIGYFMIGAVSLDLSNLNAALRTSGYPKLPNRFFSFGGGGLSFVNNLVIGGEGSGLSNTSVTGNGNEISLSGGYGMFEIGYRLFSTKKTALYPLLGMGGGGLNLRITNENLSANFPDLLKHPAGSVQIGSGAFLLDLGFGGYWLLRAKEKKGRIGGFLVGFRMGYLVALFGQNWKLQDVSILNAPKTRFSGPYFRVTIGGGGQKMK